MDIEGEIIFCGIFVGWMITILVVGMVGMITNVNQIILIVMLGVSSGVVFGIFLITLLVNFFREFKIVRR